MGIAKTVLTTTEETQETTRPEEITTEASETTTTAGETKPSMIRICVANCFVALLALSVDH